MTKTRIITLFNQSGGVAKTTLTHNLGYHLAANKRRVLLVDMDPQASLTNFLGIDPEELDKTVYNAIIDEEPLFIYPLTIHGMAMALCATPTEYRTYQHQPQRSRTPSTSSHSQGISPS